MQGAPGTAGFTGNLFTSLYVAWSLTLKAANIALRDFKLCCQVSILIQLEHTVGRTMAQLVEALRYQPESRRFDSRRCH